MAKFGRFEFSMDEPQAPRSDMLQPQNRPESSGSSSLRGRTYDTGLPAERSFWKNWSD